MARLFQACMLAVLLASAVVPVQADLTWDIVNNISQASLWDFNSRPDFLYTQPGDSRRHNAPSGYTGANFFQAQDNIRDTFVSYYGAANVVVDTAGGWNNVWVTKPGTTSPDTIYVVGSHYDTFTYNATGPAPGANDNASGVSAVLEMARIFKDYQFANTIVFAAFDGEESGLNGSYQWTAAHSTANVAGMVEMDCIGYNPNNTHYNKAIVYTGHSQSLAWRTALASAMTAYSGGVITASATDQPYDCSDYARFEDHGWQAAILAEDGVWEDVNTIMHTVNDNITNGHIDPVYEALMVKGAAGFLSTQLQPLAARGDANHDGVIDALDIDAMYANFGAAANSQWKTLYDNQVVGQADVSYEIATILRTGYGDADLNRKVNFEDFQMVLNNWQLAGQWATGDFTGDGAVTFKDFQEILNNWNPVGFASVPEPCTLALLAAGGLALRKRK